MVPFQLIIAVNVVAIGIANSMVLLWKKLSYVLIDHVALPELSDNSKKFSTHGVSDEGENEMDLKLIMVD